MEASAAHIRTEFLSFSVKNLSTSQAEPFGYNKDSPRLPHSGHRVSSETELISSSGLFQCSIYIQLFCLLIAPSVLMQLS
jgi:hypothetical protein